MRASPENKPGDASGRWRPRLRRRQSPARIAKALPTVRSARKRRRALRVTSLVILVTTGVLLAVAIITIPSAPVSIGLASPGTTSELIFSTHNPVLGSGGVASVEGLQLHARPVIGQSSSTSSITVSVPIEVAACRRFTTLFKSNCTGSRPRALETEELAIASSGALQVALSQSAVRSFHLGGDLLHNPILWSDAKTTTLTVQCGTREKITLYVGERTLVLDTACVASHQRLQLELSGLAPWALTLLETARFEVDQPANVVEVRSTEATVAADGKRHILRPRAGELITITAHDPVTVDATSDAARRESTVTSTRADSVADEQTDNLLPSYFDRHETPILSVGGILVGLAVSLVLVSLRRPDA